MSIPKEVANRVLTNLDLAAAKIEDLAKDNKIEPHVAAEIIGEIDAFADRFQVAAFGEKAFKSHQAKVLKQDADEPYMKTFENPNKVISGDSDEPYMHKTEKGFNSDARPNFDADMTMQVTDRKEPTVRDVSEWADAPKKQPSQTGGFGGKSTRQGAEKPASKPAKTWAD